ncbi:hypothetical protein PAMP_003656 [Pampus punctatissimus]
MFANQSSKQHSFKLWDIYKKPLAKSKGGWWTIASEDHVALGMSPVAPDVAPNPVLAVEELKPVGNLVGVQGHVVVEQQEKLAPETKQSPVDVQVKKDNIKELEDEVKPEDKVDPKLKEEQEVMMEKDVKVDPETKAGAKNPGPEVMAESDDKVKLEVEMESELNVSPDLKVASEVKVEPDFQWEPQVNPMFSNEQKVHVMNHDEETETGLEVEERHIDIEGKSEMMGEPGDIFPNKEAMMGMALVREEEYSMVGMPLFEEPAMEDGPLLDGGVQNPVERRLLRKATGECYCPGVVLGRRCYQFFRSPKNATNAEFYCQTHFPGGHLASITSQYNHRELMNMILQELGVYTRTWVGGI